MNDFCILPYIRNTSSCTRVPSLQFQRTIPSVFFDNVLFTGKKNAVSYSEVLGGRSSTLLGPSLPLGLFLHLPLRSASRRSNSTGIFREGKQVCIPHREKLLSAHRSGSEQLQHWEGRCLPPQRLPPEKGHSHNAPRLRHLHTSPHRHLSPGCQSSVWVCNQLAECKLPRATLNVLSSAGKITLDCCKQLTFLNVLCFFN